MNDYAFPESVRAELFRKVAEELPMGAMVVSYRPKPENVDGLELAVAVPAEATWRRDQLHYLFVNCLCVRTHTSLYIPVLFSYTNINMHITSKACTGRLRGLRPPGLISRRRPCRRPLVAVGFLSFVVCFLIF